jgi:glycosyltransferase involved in cell wall biosynthesis
VSNAGDIPDTGDIPEAGRQHVVIVAYYFPPLGGSGVQRVAKWAKYLPQNGWDVTVLTVEPGSYFAFDQTLLDEVEAAGVRIIRTRSLDPTRIRGKRGAVRMPSERKRKLFTWLTGFFFLPDNKRGWMSHARRAFNQVSDGAAVDLVLSSAPPYTSLRVGGALAEYLDVPHVVDYRDDWIDNPRHRYPTPLHKGWHQRQERSVIGGASAVLTINKSIADLLEQRHPGLKACVLPQGFDPDDVPEFAKETGYRLRLTYSGMFYDAQQPDTMLRAVAILKQRDPRLADILELRFVGLFPEEKRALVEKLGLTDIVRFSGYVTHAESVSELMNADVLWMIVGHQKGEHMISTGKLYEYMGTRRPILALAPEGEVRNALSGYDACWTVLPDDAEGTASILATLLQRHASGSLPIGNAKWIQQYDRRRQALILAKILNTQVSS